MDTAAEGVGVAFVAAVALPDVGTRPDETGGPACRAQDRVKTNMSARAAVRVTPFSLTGLAMAVIAIFIDQVLRRHYDLAQLPTAL